jgi:putative membrane protein
VGRPRVSRANGASQRRIKPQSIDLNRRQKALELSDSRTAQKPDRFEVRATADSHFGWIRTRLSVERTMMAWQRTAVALIGFGFAIVEYFNHLQQIPGTRPAYFPAASEYLGLALISCGVLTLVISLWQYSSAVRYLWGASFAPIAGMTKEGRQSPVIAVAIVLIGIGIFAFFAVLFRLA